MNEREILLLFSGPVLALFAGALIYLSGPALDVWERRRVRRGAP